MLQNWRLCQQNRSYLSRTQLTLILESCTAKQKREKKKKFNLSMILDAIPCPTLSVEWYSTGMMQWCTSTIKTGILGLAYDEIANLYSRTTLTSKYHLNEFDLSMCTPNFLDLMPDYSPCFLLACTNIELIHIN